MINPRIIDFYIGTNLTQYLMIIHCRYPVEILLCLYLCNSFRIQGVGVGWTDLSPFLLVFHEGICSNSNVAWFFVYFVVLCFTGTYLVLTCYQCYQQTTVSWKSQHWFLNQRRNKRRWRWLRTTPLPQTH